MIKGILALGPPIFRPLKLQTVRRTIHPIPPATIANFLKSDKTDKKETATKKTIAAKSFASIGRAGEAKEKYSWKTRKLSKVIGKEIGPI